MKGRIPSDFAVRPWNSVSGKSECEIVAENIMVILTNTGGKWRRVTWEEYKARRIADGGFTEGEKEFFDRVIDFTVSAEAAITFSPVWAEKAGY